MVDLLTEPLAVGTAVMWQPSSWSCRGQLHTKYNNRSAKIPHDVVVARNVMVVTVLLDFVASHLAAVDYDENWMKG